MNARSKIPRLSLLSLYWGIVVVLIARSTLHRTFDRLKASWDRCKPSSKVFSTENGFCRSLGHQTGKGWPFFHFPSTTCPPVTPRKLRIGEPI